MKTCPVIRFLGTFLLGHWYLWENFARPRFCTRRTSVPTFISKSPPPPYGNKNIWSPFVFYLPRYLQKHIVIFFSVRFCQLDLKFVFLYKARERHQCFKRRTGFQLWKFQGMLKATCEIRYTYAILETVFMRWLSESIKVITIHVDVRC